MIKIYKIVSENYEGCYVGSTKQKWLCDRFSCHNVGYRRYCSNKSKLWVSSYDILKYGDCKIELIEETEDKSREAYWIKELKSINTKKLCFGRKGDPEKIKKRMEDPERIKNKKEYLQKYRELNRDKINKQQNEKIECPICSKSYSKTNLKRHINTKHN